MIVDAKKESVTKPHWSGTQWLTALLLVTVCLTFIFRHYTTKVCCQSGLLPARNDLQLWWPRRTEQVETPQLHSHSSHLSGVLRLLSIIVLITCVATLNDLTGAWIRCGGNDRELLQAHRSSRLLRAEKEATPRRMTRLSDSRSGPSSVLASNNLHDFFFVESPKQAVRSVRTTAVQWADYEPMTYSILSCVALSSSRATK